MEERITVHEKARGETINVYIGEYRGTKYLHIREWYMDKDGEEKPTKKGIALPLEKISALRSAIDQLVPHSDEDEEEEEEEAPVKEAKPAKQVKQAKG